MKLTIFTDGASRNNPGRASYGFIVKNQDGRLLHKEGKCLGIQTNNFAEYSGVLKALEYVKNNFDLSYLEIEFFMDSKLVVQQLLGNYKIKSENLKQLINQIKALEEKIYKVSFTHIKREKNQEADNMANLALDSL